MWECGPRFCLPGWKETSISIELLVRILSMYIVPLFQSIEQRLIFQSSAFSILVTRYIRLLAFAFYQCLSKYLELINITLVWASSPIFLLGSRGDNSERIWIFHHIKWKLNDTTGIFQWTIGTYNIQFSIFMGFLLKSYMMNLGKLAKQTQAFKLFLVYLLLILWQCCWTTANKTDTHRHIL